MGSVTVRDLPRGGVHVTTPGGSVQFGLPPETIKDAMALGLEPPAAYVLPRTLFDRARGISVAEFEFPAYYGFFVLKRKTKLVVLDASVEARVRAIFQETLFGPLEPPDPQEFADTVPPDARPDFAKESDYFRNVPGRGRITVDELVDFVRVEGGRAGLAPGLALRVEGDTFVLAAAGVDVARVGLDVRLPERRDPDDGPPLSFVPPEFGVTVLGASHGFDVRGKTTGFLLWMGGRALLVDPPIDSTEYLREWGVAPKTIDGVVLTHCHADHDAGTFQKILEEGRITVVTTPHVLGSFLRKYSALSGLGERELRRTFSFQPVRIGAPVHVRGGELWFRYNLHSIPALGVDAFYGGKSLSISGDTLWDPERVTKLHEAGVIGKARHERLVSFPSHHSAVLHEAGIPPLHTPAAALGTLPDDVKERLWLVHIAAQDVPEGLGLRAARVGLESSIRVDVEAPRHGEAIALLDAFSMVDFLRDLPLSRARQLLQVSHRFQLPAGEVVVQRGTKGDSFYVLVRGVAEVSRDGEVLRRYQAGDYFGEMAILLDQPRSADVTALTDLEVIAVDRNDFLAVLRGSEMLERVLRLAKVRDEGRGAALGRGAVLSRLSSAQRTHLMTLLDPCDLAPGEVLWQAGDTDCRAVVVDEGEVTLDLGRDERAYGPGALLADFDPFAPGSAAVATARVTRGGRAFRVARSDFRSFYEDNPGVSLLLSRLRFWD